MTSLEYNLHVYNYVLGSQCGYFFSNMRKYWEEIKGHVTIFSNTCMGSGGGHNFTSPLNFIIILLPIYGQCGILFSVNS